MFYVYVVLFLLSLVCHFRQKKAAALFLLTAMAFGCFGFGGEVGNMPVKPGDFVLMFTVIVTLAGLRRKEYFNTSDDAVGRSVLVLFAYAMVVLVFTIVLGLEFPSMAVLTSRSYIILLLYFYTRQLTLHDFGRWFRWVVAASIVQGVFFYLQLVGVTGVLSGRVDDVRYSDDVARYMNFPALASFIVIYCVVDETATSARRLAGIVFFGVMLLLGQVRGVIIAIGACLGLYFLLRRRRKYVAYLAVGLLVFQFVINPMFEYRTRNSEHSTAEEVLAVLSRPQSAYEMFTEESQRGNFTFRIAMLAERVAFMLDNPRYLPCGVGTVHEESRHNIFYFNLGTHNDRYAYGRGMLGSADIAWVSILMRYGLIGVLLWGGVILSFGRRAIPSIRDSESPLHVTASLMVLYLSLCSFDGDVFGTESGKVRLVIYLSIVAACGRPVSSPAANTTHRIHDLAGNLHTSSTPRGHRRPRPDLSG